MGFSDVVDFNNLKLIAVGRIPYTEFITKFIHLKSNPYEIAMPEIAIIFVNEVAFINMA